MNDGRHVDFDRTVKTELLRNARHFVGRQHDAETQQHIVREGQQPQEQERCLHKGGQADRRDLLHPLVEAVGVAPRHAEHIQRTDRHLNQQNTAARNVGEKDFDHAIPERKHSEEIQKAEMQFRVHTKTAL